MVCICPTSASRGYARCRTTLPAQTPVAWSTFATGVNPGKHNIYDFLVRDTATYLPDLGMVERDGRVRLRVISSRRGPALSREVIANVNPAAILFTDDWQAYRSLKGQFLDHRIHHPVRDHHPHDLGFAVDPGHHRGNRGLVG